MKKIAIITAVDTTIKAFMINHLKKLSEEFEVSIITNTSDINFLLNYGIENIKVIKVDFERNINIKKDLKALFELIKIFKQEKFDSIHSITPKVGLLSALSGKFVGVQFRIHTYTGQVWVTEKGVKKFILKSLDKLIAMLNTGLLTDSESQLEYLRKEKIISKNKGKVLGAGSISGVDLKKFYFNKNIRKDLREKYEISSEDIVYGFIGRLKIDKGVIELIEAFKKLKISKKKLLIIGQDEEGLEEKIVGTNIIYLGYKNNPEYYLNMIDIFCLPSHREGFGSVIIEAGAMGIPAIASRIYGLSDAVKDGETGLLHTVKNINELKEKMETLGRDKNLRVCLGVKAQKRSYELFSSDYSSKCLIEYYKSLLELEKNKKEEVQ